MRSNYSGRLSEDEKNDLQIRKNDIIRKCIYLLANFTTTSEEQEIMFDILKKITFHRVSAYRDRVAELSTYVMTLRGIRSAHTNQMGYYNQQAVPQQNQPMQQGQSSVRNMFNGDTM